MLTRTFGNSDLCVCAIAMACDARSSMRVVQGALDRGVRLLWCQDADGESLTGRALRGRRGEQVRVATGFACDAGPPTPRNLTLGTENSLRRLGVERIDLCLATNIRLAHIGEGLPAGFEGLGRDGKIGLWGVSLGPTIGWREEGIGAMLDHGARAVASVFDIFQQDPGREFCQVAVATGAGVLARMGGRADPRKAERLRPHAEAHCMSLDQLRLKWLLQQPAVASIGMDFGTEDDVEQALGAMQRRDLSRAVMEELSQLYADDFGLGPDAHPPDLASSVAPGGKVRSSYVPPPILLA